MSNPESRVSKWRKRRPDEIRVEGLRLPWLNFKRPPRGVTVGLSVAALGVGGALLACDISAQFATGRAHPPTSAAPLILIGLAWLTLHPGISVHPIEFVKRLIAAVAFVLWGVDQMIPPGWLATVVGDIVVVLFVVDMALIIKSELRTVRR